MQSFRLNKKKLRFGPKLSYLENFGLEIEKTIVIFEISTHKFIKNDFLTNIVNFGIEITFYKGLESPFSGGSCPLCKVCQVGV